MLKKLLITTGIIALILTGTLSLAHASSLPLGGQTYYLAGAGINSTQTTIQLTSFETPDGTPVTMSEFGTTGYGVLEPQTTARIEDVSFTGITQNSNGTATLTGVTRGVEFSYPYALNVTLEKSHAGGSQFIISNTAQFYYNEFAMPNNSNDFTWPTASSSIATKGYVDNIAFTGPGAVVATTIANGYVQLATGLQAASSTLTGSTGSSLALTSGISTSTGGTATSPLKVIVTNNAGVLDQSFLPASTTLPFTYGGSIYFGTASPTYAFDIGKHEVVFTTTGTSTWAIPTGIHTVYARVVGAGGAGGNGSTNAAGGGGGAGGYTEGMINVTATSSLTVFVGTGGTVVTNNTGNPGTQSTLATTTVVNGFIGGAGSGGTISPGNPLCVGGNGGAGSGGQFNSNGQNGVYGFVASSPIPNVLGTGGMSVLGQACGGGGAGNAAGSNGCVIIDY